MPQFTEDSPAWGAPGIEPRWTQGNKDAVGTAYSSASRVWFTIWNGSLTEVYYPTIDRPQLRDLQFLICDGATFFHEEKRHTVSTTERLDPEAPGFRITNRDPNGRYEIIKDVIADPHLSCILQRVRFACAPEDADKMSVYVLAAPHMEVSGFNNDGRVAEVAGRRLLCAHRCGTWMAIGGSVPFLKMSAGYAGASDGWTDLNQGFSMDWEFDCALDGNVALTAQIDLSKAKRSTSPDGHAVFEWTLGLSFGDNFHQAATTLFQSLDEPFQSQAERFVRQWKRTAGKTLNLSARSGDGGALLRASVQVLLSHEDKDFPGALIASLSIPWGEAKNAVEVDGYHLVWPRDMVNSASGLLAVGDAETPLRALIYLAASQAADGGFPQNFWVDAHPHWTGIQLDQVSFPVLLAYYLKREGALREFDPYHMVVRAAKYLIEHGPATQQERWEENSGYSPSTLAVLISALVVASQFARERGEGDLARWIEEHADWVESNLEAWTTTEKSTWSDKRIFARIAPLDMHDPRAQANLDEASLNIANRDPNLQHSFPARDIVDAGCLQLARVGVRGAQDEVLAATAEALDRALKVDTPHGPCWKRYPHDGYGQRDGGGPFQHWGVGRPWPLLTGERAHFELQRGGDWKTLRSAIEAFSSCTGLLPEQVWDGDDLPAAHLKRGGPTGAAQPLVWAHAEYVKLLRSARDGQPFDWIEENFNRYVRDRKGLWRGQVWKLNRQPSHVQSGEPLRLILSRPFRARCSDDGWKTRRDVPSQPSGLGLHWCDLNAGEGADKLAWTFFYTDDNTWHGEDFEVAVT
jgi:glucoamylase